MTKRLSKAARLESVRSLWKICFGDPDDFIDLYFSRKYSDEVNICIEEDGQAVSALQMLPYKLNYFGEIVDIGYLSGIATLPAYRGQGYAKRIIEEAHARLAERGALFSFLIPASASLFDFYRPLGYSTCIYRKTTTNLPSANSSAVSLAIADDEASQKRCFDFMQTYYAAEVGRIQHDEDDLITIAADFHLANGQIIYSEKEGEINAVAFGYPMYKKPTFCIKEIAGNKEAAKALFMAIRQRNTALGLRTVWINVVDHKDSLGHPYAMATAVNAEKVIKIYGEKTCSTTGPRWLIDDDNTYKLKHGILYKIDESVEGSLEVVFSGTIAQEALTKSKAKMSLMLD